MKLRLKTITPVHIGTGNRYSPAEFFLRDDVVCRVSLEKLYLALPARRKKEFLRAVEREGRFELQRFLRPDERKGIDRYSLKNKYRLNTSEVREIRECIKTGFDEPYLPGSSIKGSIRTALLWDVARNDSSFVGAIRDDLNSHGQRMKERIGKGYESRIFSTKTKRGDPDGDPKYDLLKFLQVSDARAVPTRQGPKQVLRIDGIKTFSLNPRGFLPKRFTTHAETVLGEYVCDITLSPAIQGALKRPDLDRLDGRLTVLGITGRDLDDLASAEEKVVAHIKGAMRRFVGEALAKEHDLVERGKNENCENCAKGLKVIEKQHEQTDLFRIGFGVGTTYQTLFDLVEEHDPDLALEIVNSMKLGKYRRSLDGNAIEMPYPKTIEYTLRFSPMGWVQW